MIVYYIVDSDYKGKRLFRWNRETGKVLQVVVRCGEKKKGKPNMIGVYYIKESTLRGNYLWKIHDPKYNNDTHRTTKKLFDYWFNQVVNKLR